MTEYSLYIKNMDALIFLLKLAWDCRLRLPLLITIGFMILDIRMQLDINVETRRIPRPPEEINPEDEEEEHEQEYEVTRFQGTASDATIITA